MSRAFLFPGQSSRYSGLLSKMVALSPENRALASRASELIELDVLGHFDQHAEQAFARNVDVQVGVFLANHMWLRTMEAHGVDAELSAGLSLGEWNHLVHIGAVSFEDALLAVRARGEAYDAGPRGFMASIQPVDLEELQEVVHAVREAEIGLVEIVNLNSPRQHVVAGDQPAVEEVMRRVEDDLFGQPVVIERHVPMHASSFAPVGERFREVLESVEFRKPNRPYFPNRLGRELERPTREDFIELLSTHVHSPVLWRATIDHLVGTRPDITLIEVGPMKVLFNLMNRKWIKNAKFHTDARDEVTDHVSSVVSKILATGASPTAARPSLSKPSSL